MDVCSKQHTETELDLEQLKADSEQLSKINDRQEQRVSSNRQKLEQYTASFLTLQAIVLVPISFRSSISPETIKDREWLVYFVFILLSSIVFFVAYIEAAVSYYRTEYELDMNYLHLEAMNAKIRQTKNSSSHFVKIDDYNELQPDALSLFKRKVYIYFTAFIMVSLVATELYACRFILHREKVS